MKLCKDCKHCEPLQSFFWIKDYTGSRCKVIVDTYDYTAGEHSYLRTEHARRDWGGCGPNAIKFEPK